MRPPRAPPAPGSPSLPADSALPSSPTAICPRPPPPTKRWRTAQAVRPAIMRTGQQPRLLPNPRRPVPPSGLPGPPSAPPTTAFDPTRPSPASPAAVRSPGRSTRHTESPPARPTIRSKTAPAATASRKCNTASPPSGPPPPRWVQPLFADVGLALSASEYPNASYHLSPSAVFPKSVELRAFFSRLISNRGPARLSVDTGSALC